jgi:hypothetical protein
MGAIHRRPRPVAAVMTLPETHDPPVRLLMHFHERLPQLEPDLLFRAPDRDLWLAAAFTPGDHYTLTALDLYPDASITFTRQSALARRTVLNRPLPRWARWPAGVIVVLGEPALPPLTGILAGDEPPGPRYEHAIALLFAALWHEWRREPYLPGTLIDLAERVRRDFVAT